MTHIYAFGSLCRGEVALDSDIDLLALVEGRDERFSGDKFSIYTYSRIEALWRAGDAFSWHLTRETALIYSSDGSDFLSGLGLPAPYSFVKRDCDRLVQVFRDATSAVSNSSSKSMVFEFASIYLALRNLATCYSLVACPEPIFSRDAPLRLGERRIRISEKSFWTMLQCRMLATRGSGPMVSEDEVKDVLFQLDEIGQWVEEISEAAQNA